jgi:DNA-binding SARP family transcriptional activator
MNTIGRLLRILSVAILVAAIALLLDSRPSLPTTDPLTTASRINELLVFVAWLGCLLLTLGLLYRTATRTRSSPTLSIPRIRHLHPNPKTTPPAAAAYSNRAFPLILRRPPAPIEHPTIDANPAAADGPTAAVADSPEKRAEATVSISLLGPLTISGGRKQIRRPRGPTKQLLCYLALHPAGAHRDQIIDALWPDQPPEQGRNRLWRAAGDARAHFGETILIRDGEHYRLDRTQVAVDLDDLDELLAELEHTVGAEDQLPLLERALALYNGEPLSGSDLPWAENEQRRLHALRLDLLERAGRARLATSDPAAALANAETGLGYEPYNEQLARLAMQAEAALGLRGAIIDRYQNLTQLLDAQLGLQPHKDTRRLYRQLLSQDQQEPALS